MRYQYLLTAILWMAFPALAQERVPSPPPQRAEYGVEATPFDLIQLDALGVGVRREPGRAYVTPDGLRRAKAAGLRLTVVSVRVGSGLIDGEAVRPYALGLPARLGVASGSRTDDLAIPDFDGTEPGTVYYYVPLTGVPSEATVTNVRYRVRVAHTWPGDLVLQLWNDNLTATIWDRQGGADDGGQDDDPEADDDIELEWRETSVYNGRPLTAQWYLDAYDFEALDTGTIDRVELEVEFGGTGGGPELAVSPTSVSATVAPGASATRTVTLQNTGSAALTWSATASSSFDGGEVDRLDPARFVLEPIPAARIVGAVGAEARAGGVVPVIVRLNLRYDLRPLGAGEKSAQDARVARAESIVRRTAEANGARGVRQIGDLPYLAMEATPAVLAALVTSPDVAEVRLDEAVFPSLDESVPQIGGDVAHAAGFRGQGTSVAVLDTGVDTSHPDFGGRTRAEACFSRTEGSAVGICPNGANVQIGSGAAAPTSSSVNSFDHGTHVSAIAVGSEGVAPAAGLLAVTIFRRYNDASSCSPRPAPCLKASNSDLAGGLTWVNTQRQTYNVTAVNLSLGGGQYPGTCDDTSVEYSATAQLVAAGVVVVAASGNDSWTDSMSRPACFTTVFSVGRVDGSDTVASTSNSSTALDVWAPGTSITAAVPGGGRGSKSGTSMSAPHAAGAVALLRQQNPGWSAATTMQRLRTTGVPVSRGSLTRPRIAVDAALGLTGGGGGWLSASPTTGTIQPGASRDVTLTLSAAGLTASTRNGQLAVTSNGGNATVNVAMTVSGGGGSSGRDLTVSAASLSTTTVAAGASLDGEMTVTNIGTQTVTGTAWAVGWYLSSNPTWDPSDVQLNTDAISSALFLSAGNSIDRDDPLTIPSGTAPGTWYILHVADIDNTIPESNETNNVFSTSLTITSGAPGPAVLAVSPASVSFGTVAVGATATQTVTVTNTGALSASFTASVSGSAFALTGATGATLAPSASATLTVRYAPTAAGASTGALAISHSAGGTPTPITVPLSGTGQSSTGPAVPVSLPTATARVGTPVVLPVTLGTLPSGATVLGYSFTVEYDPAVVTLTGVESAGTLSAGWSVQSNMPQPGRMLVSAAGSNGIATGGALVRLVGSPVAAGQSPLTLSLVRLNEGTPAATAVAGSLTVSDCPTCGDASGDGTVSALDASYILRHVIGLANPTFYECSADASGDGTVSAFDASRVLQHTVGLPNVLTCSAGRVAGRGGGGAAAAATWSVAETTRDTVWVDVRVPDGASAAEIVLQLDPAVGAARVARLPAGWVWAERQEPGALYLAAAGGPAVGGVVRVGVPVPATAAWLDASVRVDEAAAAVLSRLTVQALPAETALGAPRPNPTRGRVVLPYDLAEAGAVRVSVVDMLGREVWTVFETREAGRFEAVLAPGQLAPGVYAVVLETSGGRQVRRLSVVR